MQDTEYADDPQTDGVYLAQYCVFEECKGRILPKVSDVEDYLSAIFESRWFQREFPNTEGFEVLDGRGAQYASGQPVDGICQISLPRAYRCELIVLHELAHCVGSIDHGPIFCSCYLALVRRFIGKEVASKLRFEFVMCRVKHRRPSNKIDWNDFSAAIDFDATDEGPVPYYAGPRITAVRSRWQRRS